MIRKAVLAGFVVLFLSFLAAGAVAADPTSFFQGVWGGNWQAFNDPGTKQDVTLTVGKEIEKGVFGVEYTWGIVTLRNRTIPGGTVKTKGREEGEKFSFKWKSKEGREFEVTLTKVKENEVKARIDRGGPLAPVERPYSETYLYRR